MSGSNMLRPLEEVASAQTSVELFHQLRQQGATDEVFDIVRAAYGVAMRVFAGRMHPSGKVYLNHCVGTASGLASVGAAPYLVVAGLLHAAYRWGDFGVWPVVRPLQRQWLRRAIGRPAEACVYRFEVLPWSVDAVRDLRVQVSSFDEEARAAVLLALANDLDNMRDRAVLFCSDAERRREVVAERGPMQAQIAAILGFPTLAHALNAATAECIDAVVPPALRWSHPSVTLTVPASGRRKRPAVVTQTLASGIRGVRQWWAAS